MGPGRRWSRWTLIAVLALAGPAMVAVAGPDPGDPVPRGFVDGKPFARFATDDGELVEVNISGSLLRSLANTIANDDKEAARTLSRLASIHAVIVGITPERVDAALKKVEATADDLTSKGWEEIATVRQRGERVRILVLSENDHLEGLAVLMVDHDENSGKPQLVFANIAGPLRLSELGDLSSHIGVPGLDKVPHEKGAGEKP